MSNDDKERRSFPIPWVFYNWHSKFNFEIDYNNSIRNFLQKARDTKDYRRVEKLGKELREKVLGLDAHERKIRDIVLGMHVDMDRAFDRLLSMYFTLGRGTRETRTDLGEIILPKVSFEEKLQILKKLKLIMSKSKNDAERINTIRNGFAHGYRKDLPRFNYKGKRIFEVKTIEVLENDYNDIREDLRKQADKLLENYWESIHPVK